MKRSETKEKMVCPKRRAKLTLVPNAPGTGSIIFQVSLSLRFFIFKFPKKKEENRVPKKVKEVVSEILKNYACKNGSTFGFCFYDEEFGREKEEKEDNVLLPNIYGLD
ncbi:hypothetical protein PVK06_021249 [Gossypium arboreum]|uniref:Uncharacterized protein n=1 Tax=Gossypium arboreum TaxID=29729 RepID=A0ABR0PPY1_GOSAR|nr:hypothetical protein PVK06_021249 [Gossypium arboreum]